MTIQVGFWWSKDHPEFPKAKVGTKPWSGKDKFLDNLAVVEDKLEQAGEYLASKGWSNCRICGIKNGSYEYRKGRYVWPSGYSHYIAQHNIRPPKDFEDYIRTGKHVSEGSSI